LRNVDLIRADLSHADLHGANLSGSILNMVDLNSSNLEGADLSQTQLIQAYLRSARCASANLKRAHMRGATVVNTDLHGADLREADLSGAELREANLTSALLQGANLTFIGVDRTIFADCDLRDVIGLNDMRHFGHSEISLSTLIRSEGNIPEIFLRRCGLEAWQVEATKLHLRGLSARQIADITYRVFELRSDPLIQFHSCFISYANGDREFARKLYGDLRGKGVLCWFAPEHMKIGDRIRDRLDESIHLHDKVLLVLSEISVTSQWVEQEVETALEKERQQGVDVLFPVRLDGAVMEIRKGWPALIRNTRNIGDFCRWQDPVSYEEGLSRLLNDLKSTKYFPPS
jgi:uncharacterized protein YjbI with pentapeptide repeats